MAGMLRVAFMRFTLLGKMWAYLSKDIGSRIEANAFAEMNDGLLHSYRRKLHQL